MSNRENHLDIMRGFVALWIVAIHVMFHNEFGQSDWARYITLIIDVPAFFFISGMTRFVIAKDMTAGAIVKFATVFALVALFFGGGLPAIINTLTFQGIKPLPNWENFNWSYWFIPVYIIVLMLGNAIIHKISKYKYMIMIGLAALFPAMYFNFIEIPNLPIFGTSVRHIAFYLSLFLFGYFVMEKIIGTLWQRKFAIMLLVVSVWLFAVCWWYAGNTVFDLQANKFPASLPYILASMLSVSAIIFMYRKNLPALTGTKRILAHVGQNAIYYYAGQMIGTGVTRKLVPFLFNEVSWGWGLKFVLLLPIALLVTVIAAEVLRIIVDKLGKASDLLAHGLFRLGNTLKTSQVA